MRLFLLSWLLVPLFVACGGDSGGSDATTADTVTGDTAADTAGTDTTPAAPTFTVVNFNAGLAAGYVDYAPDRLPLIGAALAAQPADVICLQEVWTDADAQAVIDATKTAFPHSYREATVDEGGGAEPACTTAEIDPLQACVVANCDGVPTENLATCVLGKCGAEFQAVSSGCQTCLASQIGKPLADMVTACTTSAGGSYAYEGRNGVLLLSKLPFKATEVHTFSSYMNVRVVLHAQIDAADLGNPDVYCTHLTADLDPDIQYGGTYGSWGEEQGAQIDDLLTWMDGSQTSELVVLSGDLNCGPELTAKGIEGAHADNYAKLTAAGFVDPFADAADVECSWCADNPLVTDGKNLILDHVLLRSDDVTAAAARVLDQAVEVTSAGAPVATRLSDHYGVSVTATFPAN